MIRRLRAAFCDTVNYDNILQISLQEYFEAKAFRHYTSVRLSFEHAHQVCKRNYIFGQCAIYKSDSVRNGNMIINMVELIQ